MTRKTASGFGLYRTSGFKSLAGVCVFCFGVVPAVQAYLDPGTFSFVIQTLIAALVGALFVIKSYWVGIKNWFSGKSSDTADTLQSARENDKLQEDQNKENQ